MGYDAAGMSGLKKTDPIKDAQRHQREIDAATAMAEYHAANAAELEKAARLKALRLAKVAADRKAKPIARRPKKPSKRP